MAIKRYKYTEYGKSEIAASTAKVPKMSMGINKGSIKSEINVPELFNPTVNAAPIEPMKLKLGVPKSRAKKSTLMASTERLNCSARIGDINSKIRPV